MSVQHHMPNEYLNFDLLITRAGDAYHAYVVDAPGGDADTPFELPIALHEIERLVQSSGTRRTVRVKKTVRQPPSLRNLGSRLYDAIFQDEVRSVLVASQTEADSSGRELRIRLRFSDDAVDLATLPWEILFDSEQQHFLALSEKRPILRYLSLPRPRPALVVQPPLSILAVLSSPTDHPALNVEQEWQAIEAALADLRSDEKVTLERLETPTFDTLRERLLGEPIHVLHFVGHGIFDESEGEGQLLFEELSRTGHLVPAKSVAMLLHNHSALRLVYLNACEGAIADQGNVFAGVAQTLVQQGVPAAVAMQDEITDAAAIEMARTFYTALATGRPVDAALTHARVTLSSRGNDEWVIPVLFSRSPDNRLFDVVEVLPKPDCPYPGMRPFTQEQADLFFGRDKEIDEAVNRLAQHPFLTVVGPSGSGKSSLVYAGIIPALHKSGRFGKGDWDVKIMRPSDSRTTEGDAASMRALASLLGIDVEDESTVLPPTWGKLEGGKTLLFVDQFEEVFTLAEASEAEQFLSALHALIKPHDEENNLYILLTVRADFYPDLMATGDLWASIKANRLELTPLGDDELWAAIVQPAAKVGVTVDDALAVALIADAAGESGVLPLVQETLFLLWEKVEKRALKLKDYQAMADGGRSGLQVAIDRRANVVYNNLPDAAKPIARRIFLRLIQFGQGRADTRRQQTTEELQSSSDNQTIFNQTLTTLADNRLLTTSGEEGDRQRQVDISHEALIAGWEMLREWIEEQREAETTRRRLEEKATNWVNSNRRGGLLNRFELQEAKAWSARPDAEELGVSSDLQEVIAASGRRQRLTLVGVLAIMGIIIGGLIAIVLIQSAASTQAAKDAAALATSATEVATAKLGADEQAKNARQAQALAETREAEAQDARAAAVAQQERADKEAEKARKEAAIARSRQLAAESERAMGDKEYRLALLLAVEAGNEFETVEAHQALRNSLSGSLADKVGFSRLVGHTSTVLQTTWSQDGRRILTSSRDGTARIWDAESGKELLRFQHDEGLLSFQYDNDWPMTWSQDERRILTSSRDGTARIWDAESGKELLRFQHDNDWPVTWSQDERRILTITVGYTVRIWDAESGEELLRLQHDEAIFLAIWNQNGNRILTRSGDNTVHIWDAESGEELLRLQHDSSVILAKWNQDESRILAIGENDMINIWDAESGEELLHLQHDSTVIQAPYSQDGSRIFTISEDDNNIGNNMVRIWDAESGEELLHLQHDSSVIQAVWSLDGSRILTATDRTRIDPSPERRDGSARIWDAESGEELLRLQHDEYVKAATWNQDESRILTITKGYTNEDNTVRIWDAESGEELLRLQHGEAVKAATWNPDESRILTFSEGYKNEDYTVRIWDAESREEPLRLQHNGPTIEATWNQDESRILSVGVCDGFGIDSCKRGRASVWDAESGEELLRLQHDEGVLLAMWNQDESRILTIGRDDNVSTINIWDAESGEKLLHLQHNERVKAATWNQDESRILTRNRNETVRIWDAESGEELLHLQHDDVQASMWNQNKNRILTRSEDNLVRIWDGENGKELLRLQHDSGISQAIWGQDESRVLTVSRNTVRIWDVEHGEELLQFQDDSNIEQVTWSWDESRILTINEDNTVRIWDGESGRELLRLQHDSGISQAIWGQDESRVLTISRNTVRIWDAEHGEELLQFQDDSNIEQVTWSWDESRILTINEDNTVCIWDGESGKELFRLQHNEYVVLAMWNQNKNRVLTGSIDGAVRIWTVSLPDLQSKACDRVIANMDLTEWRSRMGGAYRPICEEAEIPLDVLPFVTNEVKEYADNGNLTAAAERLGQLVGWLHKNGQFNPFGVEWADWLTTLQAGENPWAEE